jgi:3-oxosteroid 1-dehydrogenase
MAHSWGAPTLDVPKEEKFRALFVERSLPGCLVVNARGERFVNESCPYPEFQQAMFADHAAPAPPCRRGSCSTPTSAASTRSAR